MQGHFEAQNGRVGLETKLDAEIPDLARFLEHDRRGDPQPILVTGTAWIRREGGDCETRDVAGRLLLRRASSRSSRLEYELSLTAQLDAARSRRVPRTAGSRLPLGLESAFM